MSQFRRRCSNKINNKNYYGIIDLPAVVLYENDIAVNLVIHKKSINTNYNIIDFTELDVKWYKLIEEKSNYDNLEQLNGICIETGYYCMFYRFDSRDNGKYYAEITSHDIYNLSNEKSNIGRTQILEVNNP